MEPQEPYHGNIANMDRDYQIKQLHDIGITTRDIGIQFGMSHQRICKIIEQVESNISNGYLWDQDRTMQMWSS